MAAVLVNEVLGPLNMTFVFSYEFEKNPIMFYESSWAPC